VRARAGPRPARTGGRPPRPGSLGASICWDCTRSQCPSYDGCQMDPDCQTWVDCLEKCSSPLEQCYLLCPRPVAQEVDENLGVAGPISGVLACVNLFILAPGAPCQASCVADGKLVAPSASSGDGGPSSGPTWQPLCQTDSDCADQPGTSCDEDGFCIEAEAACDKDSQCPPDLSCVSGVCATVISGGGSGTCQDDLDCQFRELCDLATGRCIDDPGLVPCEDASVCPDGWRCDLQFGVCQQPDSGRSCQDDLDCPGLERCQGGTCGSG
jgi:hypothetical protein